MQLDNNATFKPRFASPKIAAGEQRQAVAPTVVPSLEEAGRRDLPPIDLLTDTILFGCLVVPGYLADAAARLQVDDWPFGWQQVVWRAMLALRARGVAVDNVSLRPLLDEYSQRLLARACAGTENPYSHDYVRVLALQGQARRALNEAAKAMEASR